MVQPVRNNDINSLSPSYRKKFDPFRKEVKALRPDAEIFEAKRSYERQLRLRNESNRREKQGLPRLTRTMKSRHLTGDAVDIVFMDDESTPQYDNKPMWK
jgi:D-alanyl-D-alanine dipeptidase